MRQLTLLAIPDCPLSAHARRVLDTLAADGLLVWGEAATGTPNGEALQPNAPDLLPALFNEFGQLLAHGRLSERGLCNGARDRSRGDVMAEPPVRPRPGRRPQPRAPASRDTKSESAGAATWYRVEGENAPDGEATIRSRASTIAFDGSAGTGESLLGPADLLAAALAACILKNVERFSGLLPFRYRHARVQVELERREPPPRIVRARYTLRIVTDEPGHRLELLHHNILRFGTITNTLAGACELDGTILAEPPAAAEQE